MAKLLALLDFVLKVLQLLSLAIPLVNWACEVVVRLRSGKQAKPGSNLTARSKFFGAGRWFEAMFLPC